MKSCILRIALTTLLFAGTLPAQTPPLINYQGRIVVGATNFEGTGQFKFALVNANGTARFWDNAGGLVGPPTEPTLAVSLPVTKGLYSVLLGDTTIPNMAPIPTSTFTAPDLRLRVWFNDGTNGFQLLTPDQRIAPTAYLADGVVNSANIADASIISSKVAPGAITGTQIASGSLDATRFATAGGPAAGQVLGYSAGGLTWTAPGGGVFSLNGTNAYYNGGNVGLGTISPAAKLDVRGSMVLEAGSSPGIFTGTGAAELNRYLTLLNSPNAQSASGLKAGGVLVSNDYAYANPGKSDLIVKGNVMIGTTAQASQTKLTIQTSPGLSVSKWGMEQTDGTVRLATYVGDGGYRTGLGTRSNHPLSFFVNDGSPSMTIATDGGVSINSASGIALDAAGGGPMITRGDDPFNSNAPLNLDGHGRWGLFKDLTTLICGFPDIAGRTFQVCNYTPDGGRNTLLVVNQGGNVGIGMGPSPGPQHKLHVIGNILASGTITGSSDRNVKRDFTPVNSSDVLDKVAALPISTWTYIADDGVRHLGPMAQDFYSAFNVGMDDKHISMVDADGVALAAIQGLNQKVEKKDAEIRNLRVRLEKLEQLLGRELDATERKQP